MTLPPEVPTAPDLETPPDAGPPPGAGPPPPALPHPASRRCPACQAPLPGGLELPAAGGEVVCPRCRQRFTITVFSGRAPALPDRTALEAPLPGAAGTCPAHPRNLAVATCDRCGAFLCELCRIRLPPQQFCSTCFARLREEDALAGTPTTHRNHLGIGTLLLLCGVLLSPLLVCCGPAALIVGVQGLRRQRRLAETEGRVRLGIVVALGALETVVALLLLVLLLLGFAEELP
ncbi:MAG: hypothetical protein RBU45_03865 [Myxococcota bacterium]|jgi:hypothetical protein|nr:hypothetical protein [Myxococcota bacterium]